MRLGEVCILTRDVPRLAKWYRALLGVGGESDDPVHQFVLTKEPSLTILRDESDEGERMGQSMCLAFTVEDMDAAYAHVRDMGAQIVTPPVKRPWGAVNMCLRDPDGNLVYLRQLPSS